MEEDPRVTIVDRDRRYVNASAALARPDEESLAGNGPVLAREPPDRAASVADKVATIIMSAQHFPARAPDRFVGGDAYQLLGRSVPRDYGQAGVKGEERVARSKVLCRSPSHGPSFLSGGRMRIRNLTHRFDGVVRSPGRGARFKTLSNPNNARLINLAHAPRWKLVNMTLLRRRTPLVAARRKDSDVFEVSARSKIRDGELEGFKRQAAEMIRLTREKDTKTLRYDWFLSEDGTECEVREGYVDADALVEHSAHIAEARATLFRDFADDHAVTLYGEPSPHLADALEAMPPGAVTLNRLALFQGL